MKRKIVSYNPSLAGLARKHRNKSTVPEIKFWNRVRNNKIGYRFIRQKVIGNYIVDFYCVNLRLVIEIDGSSHSDKLEKDIVRQRELEGLGLRFLRFSNWEVMNSLEDVVEVIESWIDNQRF